MITTGETIGGLIGQAKAENTAFKPVIEKDIEQIVDLITFRIAKQPIEEVAVKLRKDVFNLRYEVLHWLAEQQLTFQNYFQALKEFSHDKIESEAHSDLSLSLAQAFNYYRAIVAPIARQLEVNDMQTLVDIAPDHSPDYETLSLLSLHPSPEIRYLKKWIDTTLDLDTGSLIAYLIFDQQIKLNRSKTDELTNFINDTITRMGAYAIFTETWQPNDEDRNPVTTRMRILASTIAMDHKQYTTTSLDELKQLMEN